MTQTPPPTAIETVSELTDERLNEMLGTCDGAKSVGIGDWPYKRDGVNFDTVGSIIRELLSRRSLDTADGVEVAWPGRKFCEIAERNAWELGKWIKGEDDKQVVTDAALAIKTLLASRPTRNAEVGVKALEWSDWSRGGFIARINDPLEYSIEQGATHYRVYLDRGRDYLGAFNSADEAKAAAQSDFDTRIRSALAITEPERVAYFAAPTQPGHGWMHVPDEWAGRPGVVPLFASPPAQEAVTDAQVEAALNAWWDGKWPDASDYEMEDMRKDMRAALTAALQLGKEG